MDKTIIKIDMPLSMDCTVDRVAYFEVNTNNAKELQSKIENFLLYDGETEEEIQESFPDIKYLYSIYDCVNSELGIYEKALEITKNGALYTYYTLEEESDENANTKLYKNGELLSDNYFATDDLMKTLWSIYNGEITDYWMSESMEFNYKCMVEANDFKE
jgi:hypothetical protein